MEDSATYYLLIYTWSGTMSRSSAPYLPLVPEQYIRTISRFTYPSARTRLQESQRLSGSCIIIDSIMVLVILSPVEEYFPNFSNSGAAKLIDSEMGAEDRFPK